MSAQGPQKVRKSSPISGLKQGPLKAIIPVSSLMKKECNLKKSKSNSPTSSLKSRFSPDGSLSGQRSPGSLSYKGPKCKSPYCKIEGLGTTACIRRTASLDAIYLKGQWPREAFYMHSSILQVDKATQTDDWLNERKYRYSETSNDDIKLEKYIRHRLQKVNKETQSTQKLGLRLTSPSVQGEYSLGGSQTPPGPTPPSLIRSGPQSPIQGAPVNISLKSTIGRTPMRNSVEGLNQEIERLVLKDLDDRYLNCSSIPEGHRAPLADLLRQTRSVNTQTPGGSDEIEIEFGTSDPPSRDSVSPMICGNLDLSTPPSYLHGSRGSSPDDFNKFGTSPHINKFLAREPPDGCEKVNLKSEESRRPRSEISDLGFIPLKPMSTTFQFKPSLGSAFHPLQTSHSSNLNTTMFNGECSPEDVDEAPQVLPENPSPTSGSKHQSD